MKNFKYMGIAILLVGFLATQNQAQGAQAEVEEIIAAQPETAKSEEPKKDDGFSFKGYGFLKLDMVHDDSITDNVDFPTYVMPNDAGKARGSIHARQSRFGFWVHGPKSGGAKTKAQVEVDLTNAGSNTKYLIGLRHAYGKVAWKKFSLLFGQTWDVIGPVNASTVNYTVLWRSGNFGFRRPQLRGTFKHAMGKTKFKAAVALARNVGEDLSAAGGSTDGGRDTGMPQIQGRIGIHGKIAKQKAQFGIGGHYNKHDHGALGKFNSYSVVGDLVLPITSWLSLKGELFYGENLAFMLAGIGQGVNSTLGRSIQAMGGWGQAQVKATPWMDLHAGVGIDDPKDGDLNAGDRARNQVIFGNVFFKIGKPFQIQFEYSNWRTRYVSQGQGTNNRCELAFKYIFG